MAEPAAQSLLLARRKRQLQRPLQLPIVETRI